ncbi:MAG: cation diffusion facilitator family transporter [Eubacteriales bacterium]|nr:cation diffusion facilitator family transporter [Eubacteriales bacterium]MDD3200078.1 cation diffusion facilitator family transporter [Eubacteriales bacterium]MDD4122207.1 cation diffusion facilitator family transporter [Eubacteriales bacterium]MDD4630360.1 cation diffusion facilitator family transporter [Eubacteriales bacterium]
MRKFLIRTFIKDYENVKDPKVRENYGKLAGIVGIVTNLILSAAKIIIGLFVNSIAIIADGINNLADMASSAITLIGFKLAAKPGDLEHPYGHARFEYLAGLAVSFLILIIGIRLLTTSFDKILNPDPQQFSYIVVIILVLAIGVKVWQAQFNLKTGEDIHSSALKATGMDSRNDVIATTAVLISVILGKLTGLQLDGYMGCLVALFIIYSGFKLIKETSSPLLGKAPDPELVKEIEERICEEDAVLGIHDLVVHDYGPGRIFASVHIEVDAYGDLIHSHDIIDNIERTISTDLKIHLVAHMDPLETNDPLTQAINEKIADILKPLDGIAGFHDLRIVAGYTHSNIIFDIVITEECSLTESYIKNMVEKQLQVMDKTYYVVITFDKSYT